MFPGAYFCRDYFSDLYWPDATIAALLTAPGAEYTLSGERLHYIMSAERLHYIMSAERLQYTATEE